MTNPYPSNPIDQAMSDTGQVDSNDQKLRANLEYFIPLVREQGIAQTITLSITDADRYRGDFYGLLGSLAVDEELFWFTMRVNGISGSCAYDGKLTNIMIVDPNVYARLVSTYLTNHKQKTKQT